MVPKILAKNEIVVYVTFVGVYRVQYLSLIYSYECGCVYMYIHDGCYTRYIRQNVTFIKSTNQASTFIIV